MVFCAMASLLFIPYKNTLGLKGAFASESLISSGEECEIHGILFL
jgi:hypothetical protein